MADMAAARCKHYYCKDCWRGYCHAGAEGGPACLDLRCPDPACKAVVPRSVVVAVSDDAHRRRYEDYEMRSFVDDNKALTWCPAPGEPGGGAVVAGGGWDVVVVVVVKMCGEDVWRRCVVYGGGCLRGARWRGCLAGKKGQMHGWEERPQGPPGV